MQLFNTKNCIQQLKIFKPNVFNKTIEPNLPYKPQIKPTNSLQLDIRLKIQNEKIQQGMVWSNLDRPNEFDSLMKNATNVCIKVELNSIQLSIYQKQRKEELQQKGTSRKCLQPSGIELEFTKKHSEIMPAEKERQAQADEVKKICNNFLKFWRKKRDNQHVTEVVAQKEKRDQVQKIKELSKKRLIISPDFLILISNPKVFWKSTNMTWLIEEAKRTGSKINEKEIEEGKEKETTFILDTTRDHNLKINFLAFEEENGDSQYGYNDSENEEEDRLVYYQLKCTVLNIL